MPETTEIKQWVCLNCHKPIYPWNNLRSDEIYVCPSCQTHWKIVQIANGFIQVEKVEKPTPVHKCPAISAPIIEYVDTNGYNLNEFPNGSGWYIIKNYADSRTFYHIYFCPLCGQKLDPDPSIPAQRLEINRVQALEL